MATKAKGPTLPSRGAITVGSIVYHKRLKRYGKVMKSLAPRYNYYGPSTPQWKVVWMRDEEGKPSASAVGESGLRKVA